MGQHHPGVHPDATLDQGGGRLAERVVGRYPGRRNRTQSCCTPGTFPNWAVQRRGRRLDQPVLGVQRSGSPRPVVRRGQADLADVQIDNPVHEGRIPDDVPRVGVAHDPGHGRRGGRLADRVGSGVRVHLPHYVRSVGYGLGRSWARSVVRSARRGFAGPPAGAGRQGARTVAAQRRDRGQGLVRGRRPGERRQLERAGKPLPGDRCRLGELAQPVRAVDPAEAGLVRRRRMAAPGCRRTRSPSSPTPCRTGRRRASSIPRAAENTDAPSPKAEALASRTASSMSATLAMVSVGPKVSSLHGAALSSGTSISTVGWT